MPDDAPSPDAPDSDEESAERSRERASWWDRPRAVRWSAYLAVGLVLVLVAGGGYVVSNVRASFPQTSGSIEVPGLGARVTVVRDEAGVPQVYADTAEDLFFAQGFVHAQDRFFEMDVRRHITSGRLAEMFGEDALETDLVVRTLGWRRVAEQEVARLDRETRGWLESYSAGVNAYLGDRVPAELSLEYRLLGLTGLDSAVEEWTPADSVAWLKAMAWDLRSNMTDEIDRANLATALDREQIDALYPPYPFERHQPVVEGGRVVGGRFVAPGQPAPVLARPAVGTSAAAALESLTAVGRSLEALPTLLGSGDGIGSNAWVVDGEHSATGMPILANDPHLAPTLPGVWHQMGLHCTELTQACPFDVAGFTFSGFPGVVIGHNRQVAWGFTNLGADVTDLYLESVEGDRYRHGDRLRAFEERRETFEVAGRDEPEVVTVRSTVHGPVLSDVAQEFATVGANAPVQGEAPDRGSGYAVSLAWTALEPSRTAASVFALNRAGSWEDFRAAARLFSVPGQNMVYADVEGHIGYQVPGRIPIRPAGHDGSYPAPGWDPAYDWTGRYVPFAALPSVLDPEEGFFATANQPPAGPDYGVDLGGGWDYGYRSQRIAEQLRQRAPLGVQDMVDLQNDTLHGLAPRLVPALMRVDTGTRYYGAGQRVLAQWDGRMEADSAGAAYFSAVWRRLLELTFDDQVPDSVEVEGGSRWFEVVSGLLDEPSSPWWDDVDTPEVREGRDVILREALRLARDDLTRLQSRRPDGWTWGHQHTLSLENQTLGRSDIGLVSWMLNRGPWQVGGGSSVVSATGWNAAEGFEVTTVPSMRMVVSLGDLDASRWISLTGVSGHAFHPHYTDQTDLWARGETRDWPFTRDAVRDAAEDTLTLVPAGG